MVILYSPTLLVFVASVEILNALVISGAVSSFFNPVYVNAYSGFSSPYPLNKY